MEYSRVVCCFDKKNFVEYNTNNVIIYVDHIQCEAWMEALAKRYGPSIPLEDQVGVQFKTPALKIQKDKDTVGTFSALVWKNPNKGQPKIMLQGKAFMAFVSLRKETQNYQCVENTRSKRNTEDAGTGAGGNNPHGGWNDRFQQDGNKYNDHQHNGKFRNDGQFRNNGHFRNNEQNMSNGQHRSNGQFRKNEQYRSNEQYRNNEQKRNNEQYRYNGQNRNNEKYRNDGNYRRNQNEHNRTNGQEQDSQNRYREQNDRTNTRAPQMPYSVRDYLQQCMQDNFQRY